MKGHYNRELSISLEIPDSWRAVVSEHFKLLLVALPRQEYGANLGFNLGVVNPPTTEGLYRLIEEGRESQSRDFKNYSVKREDKITVFEKPGWLRIYDWDEAETGRRFTQLQVSILAGPQALYVITGTSLREFEAEYNAEMEKIIKSIRFIIEMS